MFTPQPTRVTVKSKPSDWFAVSLIVKLDVSLNEPVAPGENERAGRWWWESDDAKECGLHVDADGKLVRSKVAA